MLQIEGREVYPDGVDREVPAGSLKFLPLPIILNKPESPTCFKLRDEKFIPMGLVGKARPHLQLSTSGADVNLTLSILLPMCCPCRDSVNPNFTDKQYFS